MRQPDLRVVAVEAHPKGQGLICQHWKLGLLEILRQEGLAAVELNPGERNPALQIWRMLPIIAPQQYARLSSQLQSDYDIWLDQYGHLFDVPDRQTWQSISESSLVPLMAGDDVHHKQPWVRHIFRTGLHFGSIAFEAGLNKDEIASFQLEGLG